MPWRSARSLTTDLLAVLHELADRSLEGRRFYRPGAAGFEKTIRQLMEYREEIRRKRRGVRNEKEES